jgi:hypothetical protein
VAQEPQAATKGFARFASKAAKPRTVAKKATAPTPKPTPVKAVTAAPKAAAGASDALAAKEAELAAQVQAAHEQIRVAGEALKHIRAAMTILAGNEPPVDTSDIPEAGEEFFKKAKLVGALGSKAPKATAPIMAIPVTPKAKAKAANGGDTAWVQKLISSRSGPVPLSTLVKAAADTALFNATGKRPKAAIERQVSACLTALRKTKKAIMTRPKGGESHWALR